jgi:hypothetical protein
LGEILIKRLVFHIFPLIPQIDADISGGSHNGRRKEFTTETQRARRGTEDKKETPIGMTSFLIFLEFIVLTS